MKHLILKCIILSSFLLSALIPFAQPSTVEMATGMRSNGKIYVVVVVLCMVLLGLFFYLIALDRKISKIEKEK